MTVDETAATQALPLQDRAPGDAGPVVREPVSRWVPPVVTRPRWPVVGLVGLVVIGVALRFVSVGPLWLDEAQSVAIARAPLHLLDANLRTDGAPPLWYVLLHGWIALFGASTYSVRLMAVVPALISLPVVYSLGNRMFDRYVGRASLVLLATSPFAIRYASEARMYSLLLLLGLLGAHALLSVHRSPRPGRAIAALAVITAALLYTHYYALWLGLVVGAAELWRAWRRHDRRSWYSVGAIGVGGLAFVPWLPTLLYQSGHTGAPWLPPPSINAVLDTTSSWAGGNAPDARFAQLMFLALVVLAVAARRGRRRTVVIGGQLNIEAVRLLSVVLGVVLLAVVEAMITKQAFAPRYTSAVVGLFLIVIAVGINALPTQQSRRFVLATISILGLVTGAFAIAHPRTQAGSVVTALEQSSHPGDVVLYCPDQLGPAAFRLISPSLGLRQYAYPNLTLPQRVNWVGYAQRQENGDPYAVAQQVSQLAGNHTVWLVWAPKARTLGTSCEALVSELTRLRGSPYVAVSRNSHLLESDNLDEFDRE